MDQNNFWDQAALLDLDPFLLRMIDEYKDLSSKIASLESFIEDNPSFNSIEAHPKSLLKIQLDVMKSYKQVLFERIHYHVSPYVTAKGTSHGKTTN